jgi:cytochrome c
MIAVAGLMAAASASATDMPAIVKDGGYQCAGCHQVDKKLVGPAWRDVSKFYNGKMDKSAGGKTLKEALNGKNAKDHLIEHISKGGAGIWGKVPMSANDPTGAKKADIEKIVDFILGLEK